MLNLIDLDETPPPPVSRRFRWRSAAIAGSLLLAGALIGSFLTYGRDGGRDSTVSVLVLATTNPAEGGTPHRVAGSASVAADVQVTIVNTGPAAINVASLSGTQPGVTLSIIDKQRWIDPGTATTADALVTVDCAAGYPLRDLDATLSVVTIDDTARQSPVRFSADPWSDKLEESCRAM